MRKLLLLPLLLALTVPAQANFWRSIMNQEKNQEELMIPAEAPEVTGEAPEVTGEVPEVTGEAPEVTGEVPEVTGEAPEVTGG